MIDMKRSTQDITDRFGGLLRCETCGRRKSLDASYWHDGWPKCCGGYTMRWWTQRQIDAGEMTELVPFGGDEGCRSASR